MTDLVETCSSSPGTTHHLACPCHESAWAEKLAAAEAETTAALAWFKDAEARLRAAEERALRLEDLLRNVVERDLREVHPGRRMFDLGWRSPEWLAEARYALAPHAKEEEK